MKSNIILPEEINILSDGVSYNPEPVRTPQQEVVSAYVRRIAKKKGLSHEKIAAAAQKKGWDLSKSTVNTIMLGTVKSSAVYTLQAIAAGLGEPEDDIIALARGVPISQNADFKKSKFAALFRDYKSLEEDDQAEVEPFIKLLAEQIQQRI